MPAPKKDNKPSKIPPRCQFCFKGFGVTKVGAKDACFACARKVAR